jgi:hypothetical protein
MTNSSTSGVATTGGIHLLALLLYGYAHDVRSSRQIERACREDVALNVIAAMRTPDHSTIAELPPSLRNSLEQQNSTTTGGSGKLALAESNRGQGDSWSLSANSTPKPERGA